MKIYLVVGSNYSYSEGHSWVVRAFELEEDAKRHAERCREILRRHLDLYGRRYRTAELKDEAAGNGCLDHWSKVNDRQKSWRSAPDPHCSAERFTNDLATEYAIESVLLQPRGVKA